VSLRRHDNSNYGLQSSKKYVFKREHRTGCDVADVRCCGRLFQIRTVATGKAQSPQIESRVRRHKNNSDIKVRYDNVVGTFL